jgi:hypothetical protein
MAIELTTDLNGPSQPNIDKSAVYLVDFSKLTSVNDLVMILSAMGISFPGSHPFIETLAPFLALDKPNYINGDSGRPVFTPNGKSKEEVDNYIKSLK